MSKKKPQFSYSNTDSYNNCALQWREVVWLKKHPSESNEAAERGTMMHQWLEDSLNDGTDYPEHRYQWILNDIRNTTGLKVAEMQLAINKDWEPTGFFDADVFYRGIVDVTVLNGDAAIVTDLKTGKRRFKDPSPYEVWLLKQHDLGVQKAPMILSNARQANDYSLMIFLHYPDIKYIEFRFVWSDADKARYDVFTFDREQNEKQMIKTLLATPKKIVTSLKTKTFDPNPSGLCYQYCPVGKEICRYVGRPWSEIKKEL